MRRRRKLEGTEIDPEVTQVPTIDLNVLEIRGRGKKWHLFYPDPANLQMAVPVMKDGTVVGSVNSWVATNKMVEVHEVFTSEAAAREAAEFIHPGCEIKVFKTSDYTERAAKAAETKRRKREEASDE